MRLISLNVGMPREVMWHGRRVTTGIFKEPVPGRIALRKLNLDGDGQADLNVHGGEYKAVYCYQVGHYDYWKAQLPGRELPWGAFGENFTVDGPPEDEIFLGDRYAVGSAEVVVTQPRLPCYKLGLKFQSDDMLKRFFDARRHGFYLAVTREGEVGGGDEMKLVSPDPNQVAVSEIMRLYAQKSYNADDVAAMRQVLKVDAVPESWKEYFRERVKEN